MNVVLFGATGMVGQGVLRECLRNPGVTDVLAVGRSPTGQTHPKLRDIIHADLLDFAAVEPALSGFDACFFCLGVASAGMDETDYRRITFGITVAAATTLARLNPGMTFIYVSGAGADSSERGRVMWARVRGETENAVLRLPFRRAVIIRPAGIIPLHGISSRTRLYRAAYAITRPIQPLLYRMFPQFVTTTEKLGQAMLQIVRHGSPKPILEARDINALAEDTAP